MNGKAPVTEPADEVREADAGIEEAEEPGKPFPALGLEEVAFHKQAGDEEEGDGGSDEESTNPFAEEDVSKAGKNESGNAGECGARLGCWLGRGNAQSKRLLWYK